MCLDPITLTGMAIGAASSAATVAGTNSTAAANQRIVANQAKLEQSSHERENLIQQDAANKEKYTAALEGKRAASLIKTIGSGVHGSTPDARVAEQSRQATLSIENARDRSEASKANYVSAGKNTQIATSNRIATLQPNPLASFTQIATGTLNGSSSLDGLRSSTKGR